MCCSPFVVEEASRGDAEAAQRRMAVLAAFAILEVNQEVQNLAEKYFAAIDLPDRARIDAFHLALAVWHRTDYLLSWNCKHIGSTSAKGPGPDE
ncbi:MAG: type II toxin-antitoxin system VapC family toxin [Blastocatellia bacterium]